MSNALAALSTGIEALERDIVASENDALARYRVAVLLLEKFLRTGEASLLSRASAHLACAIALRPRHPASHAVLGYAQDLIEGGAERALSSFREAHRLDPSEPVFYVYVLTLLEETGREMEALDEIEAAAVQFAIDLHSIRQALADAKFPQNARALIQNGFLHARNHFRGWLADEADRILDAFAPEQMRRAAAAERSRCTEIQRQLERTFDASRVPVQIRELSMWAARFGVGDDFCRMLLFQQLSRNEQGALIREVDMYAREIHDWLDSFGGAPMPLEAAAFLFLALGVDEIRGGLVKASSSVP